MQVETNDEATPWQVSEGSCVMAVYPISTLVAIRARGILCAHPERQGNVLLSLYSAYHDLFEFEAS